ncbi:MAG: hypothetical protein ACOY15_09135 [Pseudomonadota bacterium]
MSHLAYCPPPDAPDSASVRLACIGTAGCIQDAGATSITPAANAAIEPAPVSNPIRTDLARSRRIALPRDAATAIFVRLRKSGVPMNH